MATGPGRYGSGQMPLAGAVLCCTSIAPEQRSQLAIIGSQMGATIKLDLTSDVTHLIVGSTDSAKYRYVAKSRDDVKVLAPTWLEALREIWMEGDDNLDLPALEAEHTLPTFLGLKICLTGFDNPEQRRHIQETVEKNGAEYHGDLTKTVTHLIAATPSGKKYEHALNWRMKLVSLEWFKQSLERGMVLEEAYYNPTLPIEQRGKGAWDRRDYASPSLGKRTRDAVPNEALNPFRRKLRRSASSKMGSQSEALWAGITAATIERQHNDGDDWTEDDVAGQDTPREPTPAQVDDQTVQNHEVSANADPAYSRRQPAALPMEDDSSNGIFQGRVVIPHGFDGQKTDILRHHLESQGANVSQTSDLNSLPSDDVKHGYLVIPHDVAVDLMSLPEAAGSMNLVTNWWVERCLHGKRLVDPADDVLSRPFDNLSISGFSGLTIHSTGFIGIDLLHVTKIVTLMGATYDEELSGKVSVIICNSSGSNKLKIKYALDRAMPAVKAEWLWECLRTGMLQPFESYPVSTPTASGRPKSKSVAKAQPASIVPTARLSTEESFELQKKVQAIKKVPKQRGPQQPRTLALALSVDPTPASTTESLTRPNTSIENLSLDENESIIPGLDGQVSFPLQDISANSPRRPSTSSNGSKPFLRPRSSSAESLIQPGPRKSKQAKEPSPDSVVPADTAPAVAVEEEQVAPQQPPEEKDYSDILAQLRANRKVAPTPADQVSARRRGRRQLGRAASTRSNDSSVNGSGQLNLDDDDDRERVQEYEPSQELGWDSPGAAKAREQMMKRLGGRVSERSVRVEGIGVVRDVESETVAGRVGRKRREKGF